jgi:plasmid stabilization system protein ParE
MRVDLDEEALGDLAVIYAWITRDNTSAADSMIGEIVDQIEALGRLPHLGHSGTSRDTLE